MPIEFFKLNLVPLVKYCSDSPRKIPQIGCVYVNKLPLSVSKRVQSKFEFDCLRKIERDQFKMQKDRVIKALIQIGPEPFKGYYNL